jgi:hypothetical protein
MFTVCDAPERIAVRMVEERSWYMRNFGSMSLARIAAINAPNVVGSG